MTVKELIIKLLEDPMDAEVGLFLIEEHISKYDGYLVDGYHFGIEDVDCWKDGVHINFIDWGKCYKE